MPPELPIGVVVEATPMLRVGIVGTLRDGGLEIAADASRGSDVIEMISSHHPGFVVVGSVTDMPLVQLVRRVRAQPDAARVLVLLGRISPEAIAELLSLEVGGLMSRSIDGADLISAVQRVLQGERVVDPAILVNDAAVEEQPESASALTAREREVLVLLASGHSNREIASSLFVSLPTVKTHLAHIYAKLGAKNRNEALGRAVAGGLL